MRFEHVIDPGLNYCPVYSVEYRRKRAIGEAWSQHARTNSKWEAYVLDFEVWLRYRKGHDRRVRVL